MQTIADEELVRRCKRELPHNTHSYEILVSRYMHHIYGLVYCIVNNREEAEDITQDVFLKVYFHIHKFEQQAAFSTWLHRIATNCALDALEKSKRRSREISDQADISETVTNNQRSSCDGLDPEETVLQKELRECINRVLTKIEREQAQLLVMRDYNDLSYNEIASLLETSLGAIKMRIHRARLAFQAVFSRFCGQFYQPSSTPSSQAKGS